MVKSNWRLLSTKDGTLGAPMADDTGFSDPIADRSTHRLIGGVRLIDVPEYVFFDPAMEARWKSLVKAFDGDAVRLVSASADYSKLLVLVEGAKYGYCYELIDLDKASAKMVGKVYAGIEKPLEVRPHHVCGRGWSADTAYLTIPSGRAAHNLPLVVLPHGGPAVRDTAEFSWWSQALASEGYAVLRPNYRGSNLNWQHLKAGFGEWGRKMQTDLSDGVRYLVKEGIVDSSRVCIVGASYGGYAALAGVTLDPGVYRCAVSVAGLSDLALMLRSEGKAGSTPEPRFVTGTATGGSPAVRIRRSTRYPPSSMSPLSRCPCCSSMGMTIRWCPSSRVSSCSTHYGAIPGLSSS